MNPIADDPLSHVVPHTVVDLGRFSVTNHLLMLVVAAALLMVVMPIAARARGVVPTGFRNFVESILQFIREDVARPVLGHHTDRFIPMLWTFFWLILTANLLGMVPLGAMASGATMDKHLEHIGGTATANLSITAGLAICAFVFIHVSGMREQGVGPYWKNFVPHVPKALYPLMLALEIIGAAVKPFSLCVRLFANMLAGHVVIAVLLGFAVAGLHMAGGGYGITLAAVAGAIAISLLEVFVAFLQAYIFTFLTTLFVGMAVHPEH